MKDVSGKDLSMRLTAWEFYILGSIKTYFGFVNDEDNLKNGGTKYL